MSWRAARAITTLIGQVNLIGPGRDRSWDGVLGDAAHSARASDHNPDGRGIVHAVDITDDDLAPGFDATALRDSIIASRDTRVKYLIHRGQIISGNGGPSPWVKRVYTGANDHFHHLHVSVTTGGEDDTRAWRMPDGSQSVPTDLRLGASGIEVLALQRALAVRGYDLVADGSFGPRTDVAVRAFQADHGLTVDGVAGPATLKTMEDALTKDQFAELLARITKLEEKVQWGNEKGGGVNTGLGAESYGNAVRGSIVSAIADAVVAKLSTRGGV